MKGEKTWKCGFLVVILWFVSRLLNCVLMRVCCIFIFGWLSLGGDASQCPISGGNGVFMARVLQQQFETVIYDNEELCKPQISNLVVKHRPIANFITPNPTDGGINVSIKEPAKENTVLTICNVYGQIVFEQKLEVGQSYFSYSLDRLSSGIYFCNITHGFVNLYAQKLLISK